MTTSSKIIAYAFNDDNLNKYFNVHNKEVDEWGSIELGDWACTAGVSIFELIIDTMCQEEYNYIIPHDGFRLGFLDDWLMDIAHALNIKYKKVKKVLINRLMLKKLYNRLNFLEVQYQIKNNTELLKAIRQRVTSRRIAINKIKRNAIYNNGLGLKLAVKAFSKDF